MTFWQWTTLGLLIIVLAQNGLSIARWILGKIREGKAIAKVKWKLILVAGALALAGAAYLSWQGHVGSALRASYSALTGRLAAQQAEADRVLGEVRAKDQAIVGMSREILALTGQANAARQRADANEARAGTYAGRVAALQAENRRLAALAAARPLLDTRERATTGLREMGFPSLPGAPGAGPPP